MWFAINGRKHEVKQCNNDTENDSGKDVVTLIVKKRMPDQAVGGR